MFRSESAEAADLDVSISKADVEWDADGWHALVEHTLVLGAIPGGELGRWTTRGREQVVGLGERAIPIAFARAAEEAARRFEATFAENPGVASWLRERGLEPHSVPGAGSLVDPPPPSPFRISEDSPRGSFVAYLDAGFGVYPYTASWNQVSVPANRGIPPVRYSNESTGYAFAARVGFSGRWAFVQIGMARWGSQEGGSFRGEFGSTMVGIDAGPLLRLVSNLELAAGAGAHWVEGQMSLSYPVGSPETSSSRIVPSAFGALRLATPVKPGGARIRISLEVRQYFDPTLQLAYSALPDGISWQELALGTSVGMLIGFELPVGPR